MVGWTTVLTARARQIKKLGYIIAQEKPALLSLIDQHDITIDGAFDRANQSNNKSSWQDSLDTANNLIADIPQSAIADKPKELLEKLIPISHSIDKLNRMASSLIEKND